MRWINWVSTFALCIVMACFACAHVAYAVDGDSEQPTDASSAEGTTSENDVDSAKVDSDAGDSWSDGVGLENSPVDEGDVTTIANGQDPAKSDVDSNSPEGENSSLMDEADSQDMVRPLEDVNGQVPASSHVESVSPNNESVSIKNEAVRKGATVKASASTASAPVLAAGDYVIHSSFVSYVLDVSNGSKDNGGNIQLYEYNGTNAQKWRVSIDKDGFYSFQNLGSGLMLDLNAARTVNGSNIIQYASNGTLAQKWVLTKNGNGFVIASAKNRNYVIDVYDARSANGTNIQLFQSNGTAAQTFSFTALVKDSDVFQTPLAQGDYLIQSVMGGYVLDVSDGSNNNGANVQLYVYNGTNAQKWRVTVDERGLYSFKNVNSGKMLDLSAAKAISGRNIDQYAANNTKAQKWIVTEKYGQYTIASAIDPLFVIDIQGGKAASSTNVQLYFGNGTNAQLFGFISLNPSISSDGSLADGVYVIGASSNSGYVLDVSGGSIKNEANVQLYQSNGSYAQRWGIVRGSNNLYTVFNLASGKVLDVKDASPLYHANVRQYTSNDTKAQQWAITKNSDGTTYTFANAVSGLVLDIRGAKIANGSNIQQFGQNNTAAQKFSLKASALIDEGTYEVLTTRATSVAIDVPNASLKDGQALQIYTENDTPAQHVYVRKVGDGQYTMQIVGSGKYLTDENGIVTQRGKKSDNTQMWAVSLGKTGLIFTNVSTNKKLAIASASASNGTKLVTTTQNANNVFSVYPRQLLSDGVYTLTPMGTKNERVMDVADGSWSNGANVRLYVSNNTNAQKFVIYHVGGGYYRISMPLTGTTVEVANYSTSPGGNVATWKWDGSDQQQWKPTFDENGLAFVNKRSGLVLQIAGSADANGTNINQGANSNSIAQRWQITSTAIDLSDKDYIARLVRAISGSSSVTASFTVDPACWTRLISALQTCWGYGYSVGFLLTDLQSGNYVQLNADKTYYGASTMKAAYVTWIFQSLLESGRVSWGSVSDLIWETVVYSNNDSYHALRDRFGDGEFISWLNGVGLSGWGGARYTFYTPRELQLMWVRMLSYEQSGGRYVSTWRSVFNHSYYSQIYYELDSSATTYTKPGWYPREGNYGALDDSGIVIESDGRRYLLTIMSDINCYGSEWVERDIVGALDAIFRSSPKY